jgi:hypothetical protein
VIAQTNANEPQKWVCRKLMTARHGEISTRGNENTGKFAKAFSLKLGSTVSGCRSEIERSCQVAEMAGAGESNPRIQLGSLEIL